MNSNTTQSIINKKYYDLKENKMYESLSREEQEELFKAYIQCKRNNNYIKKLLINHNLKLVLFVINKISNSLISEDIFDDLFQEGTLGLIQAIKRYEVDRENSFATYAYWFIESYIKKYLKEYKYSNFKLSKTDAFLINKIEILKINDNNISDEEIMNTLNISKKKLNSINKIGNLVKNTISIDITEKENYDDINYKETIPDPITSNCYDEFIEKDAIKSLFTEIFNNENIFTSDINKYIYHQRIFTDKTLLELSKELNIKISTISMRFFKMNKKVKRIYGKKIKNILI